MEDQLYLGAVLLLAMLSFWMQRLRTDITAVLVMMSLVVPWPHPDGSWASVLTYHEGFSGFGSPAVVMIAAMFVIGGAIVQTGAAEAIGLKWLRKVADQEWQLQLAILISATVASMFINDTTVVLILLPLIMSVCKEKNLPPSRYLLFAAFGSLLGGQWTLIGTRSNIILSDFLRQRTDSGIGFFDFTPVAAAVFLVSAALLIPLSRRFLPFSSPAFSDDLGKAFLTEIVVPEGSAAIGRKASDTEPFIDGKLAVIAVLRRDARIPQWLSLRAGDLVIVRGSADKIGELIKSADFKVKEETKLDREALESVDLVTAEAMLPINSYYARFTLDQLAFDRNHGVTVVGLARQGSRVDRPMDTRLRFGDSLLVLGSADDIDRLRQDSGLIFIDQRSFPAIGKRKAGIIVALLASVVFLAVTDVLSPAISVPLAAVLAILFRCISLRAVYSSVDWPTIVTLASMIPLGIALEKTGSAEAIAALTVDAFAGYGPTIVLAALLLIAILFTQLIENAAVAIIVAPIAYQVALSTGVEPKPVMIALAICISAGFCTPVAHESTLLVMGPGKYRFKHYLVVGSVLAFVTWLGATLLTPVFWPLR